MQRHMSHLLIMAAGAIGPLPWILGDGTGFAADAPKVGLLKSDER